MHNKTIEVHTTQHSNTTTTTQNTIPTNTPPSSPVGVLGPVLGGGTGSGVANNCVVVVWIGGNVLLLDSANVPWGIDACVELVVPWGVKVLVETAGVGRSIGDVVDTGAATELEVISIGGMAVIFLDSPQVVPNSFMAHTMKL